MGVSQGSYWIDSGIMSKMATKNVKILKSIDIYEKISATDFQVAKGSKGNLMAKFEAIRVIFVRFRHQFVKNRVIEIG